MSMMDKEAARRLEEAVTKALKNTATPPKRKHERNIIIESWNERGASAIFMEIFRKPLHQKEYQAFKSLVVIHKVLREGHPKALVDAHVRKSFFDAVKRQYQAYPADFGKLISGYAAYIIAKLDFHHAHSDLDPTISLEKYTGSSQGFDASKAFTLVTNLLDLQQAVIDFEHIVFAESELTECKVSCLVPLVVESYNVYTLTVHLLRLLSKNSNNMDVFSFLVEKFYAQYIELRKFYFNCNNIRFLTAVIAVPMLPQDPPKFETSGDGNVMPKKKKQPVRRDTELEIEVPAPTLQQPVQQQQPAQVDLFSGFFQQTSPPQPTNPNPYSSFNNQPNPFFNNPFGNSGFLNAQPVQPVQPAPVVEKPADPFADLLKVDASQQAKQRSQSVSGTEQKQQVIVRKVIQKEVPEEVKQRLAELEARVLQLEAANKQLQQDKAELLKQNAALKQKIEEQAAEKQKVLEDQIALAQQALTAALFKFDDPNYMGNQAAIAQEVLEAAQRFKSAFAELVDSVKTNGSKTVELSKFVADKIGVLLQDLKGVSHSITDASALGEYLASGRAVGETTNDFLGNAKLLVGQLPDAQQLQFLTGQHGKFNNQLDALLAQLAKSIQKQPNADTLGIDLEDMAERELLKAAAMIEEAARQLELQNQKRLAERKPNETELNVEDSILMAATAITQATQALVRAASEAQTERVQKGKANDPSGAKYHKDPMWVEGLISAARAVAEATRQLVQCANEAAQGNVDESALIAASKAVASSTAQLVAATRAKSTDPFGKTQTKLDNAAQAVAKATAMLVKAAKRREDEQSNEMLLRTQNFAEGVKAEIDQQAKILRLEKELENARKFLFGMRKAKYADSREAAANTPSGPTEIVNSNTAPNTTSTSGSEQTASTLSQNQKQELASKLTRLRGPSVGQSDQNQQPLISPRGGQGQGQGQQQTNNNNNNTNPFM